MARTSCVTMPVRLGLCTPTADENSSMFLSLTLLKGRNCECEIVVKPFVFRNNFNTLDKAKGDDL